MTWYREFWSGDCDEVSASKGPNLWSQAVRKSRSPGPSKHALRQLIGFASWTRR